jgi:predicted 2-oxoglutarate/Fe(II)-dependent dioxygenase YbiX
MDKNLGAYLKIYKDCFDEDFCKQTVQALESSDWTKHHYSQGDGTQHTHDNDLSVSESSVEVQKIFNEKIWDVLHQYVVTDMKALHGWFSSWQGFSAARFNRYDPTTEMRLHCDHIHTLFEGPRKGVPILSVLGALNKDYTGGEFIMWEDEVIDIPVGAIAVFPSNFLFPHEVRPVKSGVRYSYVSWAW